MDSEALKNLVVDALEDIKGHEIVCLDVTRQTDIADHMVVASGNTPRQVKALADSVVEKSKAAGVEVLALDCRITPGEIALGGALPFVG